MPSFKLLDQIAHPCKITNEDLFDHNAQAAWIFDGASGIGPRIIAEAPTDPYWLVHNMNDALKAVWNDNVPTKELFRKASESVIERFGLQAQDPVPPLIDRPTACLTMARFWQDRLELSTAGDCWLLHESPSGVSEFGMKTGEAAAPVYRELDRLKAAGVAGKDLVERLLPLEREFRAKANIDGGYVILDLTTRWVERMTRKICDAAPGDHILLMTDGFYRLIDTVKKYDAARLMEASRARGLESLYGELRELENSDENCNAFPRIKVRDDVAAALLRVEP